MQSNIQLGILTPGPLSIGVETHDLHQKPPDWRSDTLSVGSPVHDHSGLQSIENGENRDGQDGRANGGWSRRRLALPIATILDSCVPRFWGGLLVAISTSVLSL